MITSITPTSLRACPARRRASARRLRAFTLVEMLVSVFLGAIVMAGVLSSFLMIGRSGVTAAHYSTSETEIRRGLEAFSQDVRMAKGIHWNSATSVTLTVPDSYTTSSNQVTYAFDATSAGPTAKSFYRVPGSAGSTAARTVFVRKISTFQFARYNRMNNPAVSDAETKRVQITMNVRQTAFTLVAANTTLVSASYMLRNKAIN